MTTRTRPIACFLLALTSGCGIMAAQMIGRESVVVHAPNPLVAGTESLRASARPAHNEVRAHASRDFCSDWPVEDLYLLNVTDERVCATVIRATDKAYGDVTEIDAWKQLPVKANRAAKIPLSGTEDRLIASCTAGGSTIEVWTRRYEGCIDNTDLISAETTQVVIDGDVTWRLTR